jgi:hypothetical protein
MDKVVLVLRDEEKQQPIPSMWRQTISEVVDAFRRGNFQLTGVASVRQLSTEDAARIARNLEGYGAQLTSLPQEAWETSACQWMRGYWDALIDLYTVEQGASDLALSVRVYEVAQGHEFQVESVHVP